MESLEKFMNPIEIDQSKISDRQRSLSPPKSPGTAALVTTGTRGRQKDRTAARSNISSCVLTPGAKQNYSDQLKNKEYEKELIAKLEHSLGDPDKVYS